MATGLSGALKWENATQSLLGRLRRARLDSGFQLAHLVVVAGYHSHWHLQLVGRLPQRLVLTWRTESPNTVPDPFFEALTFNLQL